MIKEFKENPVRDTGVINRGMFEQIKMLYQTNPGQAGELAISMMELALTKDISSNDPLIQLLAINHGIIVEKNIQNYERKREASERARIDSLKLVEIAEMLNKGISQKMIADKLGEKSTTINYRVKIIREEFPELLNEKSKNTKNLNHDNVNDNDNDNVNDKSFLPSSETVVSPCSGELGALPQTPSQEQKKKEEEFKF